MSEEQSVAESLRQSLEEFGKEEVKETPEVTEVVSEQEPETPEVEALTAPEFWSEELTETWSGLDRDVQQTFIDMEDKRNAEFTRKQQDNANTQKEYDQLDTILSQYGVTGDQRLPLIRTLLDTRQRLTSDPTGTIEMLARQMNVNLNQSASEDVYEDDAVKALKAEIAGLKQQIPQITQTVQQSEQARFNQQINDFKAMKGSDGVAMHPHFDAVQNDMVAFVSAGKSLPEAYDLAVYSNPEVRKLSDAEAKRSKDAADAAKAERAKEASKAPRGKAKTIETDEAPTDLRDHMSQLMRKQTSSGVI